MDETITLSFNREFARQYGVTAALIYQEIYRKYFYWESQGKLTDGFFWCDQSTMADWLLISTSTLARAIKTLKDAGLIETETHYKPGSSATTTWWRVSKWNSSTCHGDSSCETSQNDSSYIKADTKADIDKEFVVRVEKWDFDSKGNWKRKRTVYTTIDEADKIEGAEKEEYVTFGFWPSPTLVGNQDKMKTMNEKKTKLKTEYPDTHEDKPSRSGGYMEGISWEQ